MPGYLAEVIHCWPAEPGTGYLETWTGDILIVLYVGSRGTEKGWLYAQRHAVGKSNHVADNAGWVPASVTRTTVKKAVPVASESGYLTPLSIGDTVEVLYVGNKLDEEGWIFARRTVRRSCNDANAGWLKANVLRMEGAPADQPSLATPDYIVSFINLPPGSIFNLELEEQKKVLDYWNCLLYTSPSPRD